MSDFPLIRFQDIHKSYGKFQVLRGINIDIHEGKFIALLGPNGAGKTTLINCLAGMVRPTSGKIFLHGREMTPYGINIFAKKLLGIVEQELVFDPFFTSIEILRLRRGLYGLPPDDEYLKGILHDVGLSEKIHSTARGLSGGMKRRLMIAKALAHNPQILVLDEPTAGVDIDLRQKLYDFCIKLKNRGVTIILTTHYLEEAEKLSEETIILHQGKIRIQSPTAKLLENQQRILEITFHDGKKIEKKWPFNQNFVDLIRDIPNISDIRITEAKLETVFQQYTKEGE